MFLTSVEKDDEDKYNTIIVDDKIFYYLKTENKSKSPQKKYSAQFKDKLFQLKDTHRKLRMIEQFDKKYKNINEQTEKYISCIEEAILLLKKDYSIDPKLIFGAFDLVSLGFDPEDYGIERECTNEE